MWLYLGRATYYYPISLDSVILVGKTKKNVRVVDDDVEQNEYLQ
jgi:hypothetical protein